MFGVVLAKLHLSIRVFKFSGIKDEKYIYETGNPLGHSHGWFFQQNRVEMDSACRLWFKKQEKLLVFAEKCLICRRKQFDDGNET